MKPSGRPKLRVIDASDEVANSSRATRISSPASAETSPLPRGMVIVNRNALFTALAAAGIVGGYFGYQYGFGEASDDSKARVVFDETCALTAETKAELARIQTKYNEAPDSLTEEDVQAVKALLIKTHALAIQHGTVLGKDAGQSALDISETDDALQETLRRLLAYLETKKQTHGKSNESKPVEKPEEKPRRERVFPSRLGNIG